MRSNALRPDKEVRNDNFTVRWTGFIRARQTANYSFILQADNEATLMIAGKEAKGAVKLLAGRIYPIEVKFKEFGGPAKVILSWRAPGLAVQRVPEYCLLHRGGADER